MEILGHASFPPTALGRQDNEESISRFGKTPKETYAMLVRVHEDQALYMKCVYEWLAHFREGSESVSDKICSGRPGTSVSDKSIKKETLFSHPDSRQLVSDSHAACSFLLSIVSTACGFGVLKTKSSSKIQKPCFDQRK
ncbi:hypothetical protein TNCV_1255651 [Trichonephila clavipes]|nr:hypothetical protein TNCV_1255651 [Trichonephila clavipes]